MAQHTIFSTNSRVYLSKLEKTFFPTGKIKNPVGRSVSLPFHLVNEGFVDKRIGFAGIECDAGA